MGKGGHSSLSVSLGISLNHSSPVRVWAPRPCEGAWTVCTTPQGWGTLLGAAELPAQPDRVGAARVGFRQ